MRRTFAPDSCPACCSGPKKLELLDLGEFEDMLGRAGGHRGARRLRHAVTIYQPPPYSRSGLERRFRELVIEAGLPQPAMGLTEIGYELDAYWPEARFAVELDVYETHGTRGAFEEDRLRSEKLKLAGIEIDRITGHRLKREPKQVMEAIAQLLTQRRRQLAAEHNLARTQSANGPSPDTSAVEV